MRKFCLLFAVALLFMTCGKPDEITDTCITSCNSSTPGKVNIAVEDHTGLDISNLTMEINGTTVAFNLIPKAIKGKYSCWQSFDEVASITLIQFDIGDNAVHQEFVNYENIGNQKEFSIDIQPDESEGIRIQLVSDPDCVSSPT